eukprot:2096422-Amphidinium_carterae.1
MDRAQTMFASIGAPSASHYRLSSQLAVRCIRYHRILMQSLTQLKRFGKYFKYSKSLGEHVPPGFVAMTNSSLTCCFERAGLHCEMEDMWTCTGASLQETH